MREVQPVEQRDRVEPRFRRVARLDGDVAYGEPAACTLPTLSRGAAQAPHNRLGQAAVGRLPTPSTGRRTTAATV